MAAGGERTRGRYLAMSQLAPDDRVLHSRSEELGAMGSVLFSLQPERLVFFRVDEEGRVTTHGDPAVLVVKETELPLLERSASLYRQAAGPGPLRVFWYTPAEYAAMRDSDFVRGIDAHGEEVTPPPPGPPAEGGGSCGLCGPS
jgi:hypothetical protein